MGSDFTSAWNDKYFYTNFPHYPSLKRLCTRNPGADFEYLDFLCEALVFGDFLYAASREQRPSSRNTSKPLRAPISLTRRDADRLLNMGPFPPWRIIISGYGMQVVDATLRTLQSNGLLKRNGVASDLITPRVATKISSETLLDYTLCLMKTRLGQEYPAYAQREKVLQAIMQPAYKVPLLQLYSGYHALKWRKRSGTKYDHWGSLFLVAVTQHLFEKTQKRHHGEAITLLKVLRRESVTAVYSASKSCIQRIKRFTNYYPPSRSDGYSWLDGLALLQKQMALCKAKTHPLLPSLKLRYQNPKAYERKHWDWSLAVTKR